MVFLQNKFGKRVRISSSGSGMNKATSQVFR